MAGNEKIESSSPPKVREPANSVIEELLRLRTGADNAQPGERSVETNARLAPVAESSTKLALGQTSPGDRMHPYVYPVGSLKNPASAELVKASQKPNGVDLVPINRPTVDPSLTESKQTLASEQSLKQRSDAGVRDSQPNAERTDARLNLEEAVSKQEAPPHSPGSIKPSPNDLLRLPPAAADSSRDVAKSASNLTPAMGARNSSDFLMNVRAEEGRQPRPPGDKAQQPIDLVRPVSRTHGDGVTSGGIQEPVPRSGAEAKPLSEAGGNAGEVKHLGPATSTGPDGATPARSQKQPAAQNAEVLHKAVAEAKAPSLNEIDGKANAYSGVPVEPVRTIDTPRINSATGTAQGNELVAEVRTGRTPQTGVPATGTKTEGAKQPGRVPLSTASDVVPPATITDGRRNDVQSPAVKPGVTGGAKAEIPTSKIQTGVTKPNAPGNKGDAGNPSGKQTGDARTIKGPSSTSSGQSEFDPRQGKPRAVKQTDGREPGAEKPPKSPSSIEPTAKVPGARINATDIGQTRIASGKTGSKQSAAESSTKTTPGIKSGGGRSEASPLVGQKSRGDEGKRGFIDGQKAQVNDGGSRGFITGQKSQGLEGGHVSSDGKKSQATDGGKRGLVNAEHQPAGKFGPLDAAPAGIRRGLAGTKPANSPTEVKAEKGFVSNGLRGNSEAGAGGKRGSGLGPGGAKRADGGINQEVKQGSSRIGDASSGRRPQIEGARTDVGNVRAEGQTGRAARAEAVSGHSNSGRAHGGDSPRTEAKFDSGKVGSALGDIIKTNLAGVKYGAKEDAKAGTAEGRGGASGKRSGAPESVNGGKTESAESGKAPSSKGDKATSPKSDSADFVKNPATEPVRHGLINAGKQGQRVVPERTVVGGVVDATTPKSPNEGSTRKGSVDGTSKKGHAEAPTKKGPFELAPGSLEAKPNLTERPKPPAALPQAENPHGIVRGDKFTAKPLSPAKQPLEPGKPLATKGEGGGFEVPLRGVRNALGDLGQKFIEKISRTLGEVKADAAKSQPVKLVYGLELARVLTAALKAGAQRADVLGGNPQQSKDDAQRRPVVDAPQRGPAGDAPQRRAVGDGAHERRPLIDASNRAEMQLTAANTLTVSRLVPKGVRDIPVSDQAIDKIKLTSRLETPTVRATALHRLETAAINAKTVPVIDRAHHPVEIRAQQPVDARLHQPLETKPTPFMEAHTVRVEQTEFRPMTGRADTADGAAKAFDRLRPGDKSGDKPKAKDARPTRQAGEPVDGRHAGEAPRHIRDVFLKFNISIPKRSFHPSITDSGSYVALDDASSQRLNTFISSGTHKALKTDTEYERRSNRSGWFNTRSVDDKEVISEEDDDREGAASLSNRSAGSTDEKQLARNSQAGTAGDTARKVYIVQAGDTSESIALAQLHDHRLARLIESINEPLLQAVYDPSKNSHIKVLPVGAMILLPNQFDIEAFRDLT